MVERRQPSSTTIHGGYDDQPQPISSSETYESIYISTSNEQETYIIQIPREQIFSIPPPENSTIAERYKNLEKKENRQCKRLSCVIATLVAIGALIGIIIGTIRVLFNPQAPSLSILKVDVLYNKMHTNYEIKLKAKNENSRFGNIYGSDGEAILLYNGRKIGEGKFPEFDQDGDSSINFQLRLNGSSNGGLSQITEKSIGYKRGKRHVALRLEMNNVPVKIMVWNKVINVVCNFKVSSLGATDQKIISQQCKSTFKGIWGFSFF